MATYDRQPTSRFEKFLTGLKVIVQAQPGAKMDLGRGGTFLVGNTEDPFVTKGMRDYLSGLGFSVDSDKEMFSFQVKNE